MIRDIVTLNSGKQFPCKYLGAHPNGILFINVKSNDLQEIIQAFSDTNETAKIFYNDAVHENYTVLQAISKLPGDGYRVTMMKDNGGGVI